MSEFNNDSFVPSSHHITPESARTWLLPDSAKSPISCPQCRQNTEACLQHDFLGGGQFGSVWKGNPRSDTSNLNSNHHPSSVALKVLKNYREYTGLNGEKIKKSFEKEYIREIEIMEYVTDNCQSESLLKLIQVYYDVDTTTLCVPLLGCDVFSRIVQSRRFTEADCVTIVRQVVDAVQTLHHHNICHFDIKLENIVYKKNTPDCTDVVLLDFGLARKAGDFEIPQWPHRFDKIFGTEYYLSPEIVTKRRYGPEADAWAIGVMLYTMFVGKYPFKEKNEILKGKASISRELRSSISDGAIRVMGKLLIRTPEKRISLDDLAKDTWFSHDTYSNTNLLANPKYFLNARQSTVGAAMEAYPDIDWSRLRDEFMKAAVAVASPNNDVSSQTTSTSTTSTSTTSPKTIKELCISLDYPAFQRVMISLGLGRLSSPRVFHLFDRDGSGSVDYREFLLSLTALQGDGSLSHRFIFSLFDADNSGCIDLQEFKSVLQGAFQVDVAIQEKLSGGTILSDEQLEVKEDGNIESLYLKIDADHSGNISFEEFTSWYNTSEAQFVLNRVLNDPLRQAVGGGNIKDIDFNEGEYSGIDVEDDKDNGRESLMSIED